ncbi:MAG: hypothetical protein JNK93_21140 [Planctomycetia bacterium]|nr:hypothetical protein [Planctomycetia bacterium]
MSTTLHQPIGGGLYTVAEAAIYARVSPAMMNRWLFGSASGEPVFVPQYQKSDHKQVGFLDLVQALAIREIRLQRKVSLGKIRQAIRVARENYRVDYPFATKHRTYLFGDDVVIRLPGMDNEFVQITGRHRDQRMLEFVEMYLEDLSFDPNGLANRYHIFRSRHDKPVPVVMDPELRFGEPLLPSGYTALNIWDAIRSEGSISNAANSYGIAVEEVEAAYQFYNHLNTAAA